MTTDVQQPADPAGASAPKPHKGIAPRVFWPALIVIGVVAAVSLTVPETVGGWLETAQTSVVSGFGWYYVALVAGFVGFAIWMGLSRFGDIKLGKDDEDAEFGLLPWFAMLFAAGMGIGLVFWGAAEPLTFFDTPKPGVEGSPRELAQMAMAQTFLHWGFHAWAIYVVVGLALAYAIHRKGRPISIRWALEPLLGDRVKGWLGDLIDVVAIVGTIFGVATSLGLGVQQISSGLVYIGLFEEVNNPLLVGLIVIITLAAIVSVVSGVGKGIKWLSNINLGLAGVFLISILLLGPTLFLLREFIQSIGVYFQNVLPLTFDTSAYTGAEGQAFQGAWTTFYWGWWISWAPFVGVFIARISRGRTIREFVMGVLLVPTSVTFLWFAVLGGSAIYRELMGPGGLVNENPGEGESRVDSSGTLFNLVGDLPLGGILAVVGVILVAVFFITSSDSGSLVVDMLASGGDQDPPKWSRVLWCALEGAIAAALLLAGGLTALQTGAIMTALPFSVVMVAMCFATVKALRAEHWYLQSAERRQRREELARWVGDEVTGNLEENFHDVFGEQVDDRITTVLSNGEESNGHGAGNGNGNGDGAPSSSPGREPTPVGGGQPALPDDERTPRWRLRRGRSTPRD